MTNYNMQKKYLELQQRFQQLETDLQNPAVLNDSKKIKEVSQEYTELKPAAEKIKELGEIEKAWSDTQSFITAEADPQLKEMAVAELPDLENKKAILEKELEELTRPQDPFDKKMLSWKSEPGSAEMNPLSFLPSSIGCTTAMPIARVGKHKF